MTKEAKQQLREIGRREEQVMNDANVAWQKLLVATAFGNSGERLASLDTAKARETLSEYLKTVQAMRELRAEREQIAAEG